MAIDLQKEAPNVVTTQFFQKLIREGFHAEVVCKSTAFKKANVWYAEWFIRILSPDKSAFRMLASTTIPTDGIEEIRFRTFKTANGLISFLHAAGYNSADIPFNEGDARIQVLPADAADPSGSEDTVVE
ncbi:hypothetical protein [Loktanella sp. Alg231-35]|jgi:hypothetical protein|uniref:hypothetical protein n=1 Tax=Loktanella sp. Alg231-35 TaxID=1922220 RepID=UPI000D5536A3|nr:hypothetical protein [Loktanella sp. Alg231-35]